MTFLKFYAFIIALGFLKALLFGHKSRSNKDGDEILGEFIAFSIVSYITYHLLIYSTPETIKFFKNLLIGV